MEIAEQQKRFTEWTRDYSAMMYHVVNGFATGADRDDLLQELLLATWKAIPGFRGQSKPSTYLYRVCHNAALLWVRSEKNYQRRIETFESLSQPGVHNDVPPDDRLAKLYAAIHQMRAADRSLILMSLDGLSYREMAEVFGLSESNVGVRLTRIKHQLTETLKAYERS